MELINFFIDFVLHLDKHLNDIVSNYKNWTYLILFLIIFCETGLVITPILPGDSLLFASGAIAATSSLDLLTMVILLIVAAFLGDIVNYSAGKFIGPKVFDKNYKFFKKEYLEKTQLFYEKHGGKTIIIGRFIPIIRTFAPFVAGIGTMNYKRFMSYNIVGAISWISIFTFAGYFFGNIPVIKQNFSIVIFSIIIISLIPVIIGFIKTKTSKEV